MPVQITSLNDFDYAAINSRTSDMGKVALIHRWGFDPVAKFQRISVAGRRLLSTQGGPTDDLTFKVTGAATCRIVSQDMFFKGPAGRNGLLVLEGVSPGTGAKLELQNKAGKAVDSIEVAVAEFNSFKIRYYNLIDGKSRKAVSTIDFAPLPPNFSPVTLTDLTDKVNSIVSTQCDCMLFPNGGSTMIDLSTPNDMGERVNGDMFNIFRFGNMDKNAQYHVVFVWAIAGGHTNGITKNNTTLLQASLSLGKRPITLAHEFVHFLSGSGVITVGDHDDKETDLLFKSAPHGINLRKARLQKIVGLRKPTP